jgi:hypothetical protein
VHVKTELHYTNFREYNFHFNFNVADPVQGFSLNPDPGFSLPIFLMTPKDQSKNKLFLSKYSIYFLKDHNEELLNSGSNLQLSRKNKTFSSSK